MMIRSKLEEESEDMHTVSNQNILKWPVLSAYNPPGDRFDANKLIKHHTVVQ